MSDEPYMVIKIVETEVGKHYIAIGKDVVVPVATRLAGEVVALKLMKVFKAAGLTVSIYHVNHYGTYSYYGGFKVEK